MTTTTLHEALRAAASTGQTRFAHSGLTAAAPQLARRAHRRRLVKRGSVGVAGVAAAGALWVAGSAVPRLGGESVSPATPSPLITAPAEPATIDLYPGQTLHRLDATLREQWGPETWYADLYSDHMREGVDEWLAVRAGLDDERRYGVVGNSLEGWIAPGEYSATIPGGNPDNWLKSRVLERYDELAQLGVAPEDMARVLTIASLIEREANNPEYMPGVSAVIHNRLDAGLRLELDSSVTYAVRVSDGVLETDADAVVISDGDGIIVTTQHQRELDSRYNTYLYPGLPPGPIGTPSHAAIVAAVQPEESTALFFVPVNLTTGEIAFADTFEEHLTNVEQLRAWLAEQGDAEAER